MALDLVPKGKLKTTISLAVTEEQKERLYFYSAKIDELQLDKSMGDLQRQKLDELLDEVAKFLEANYGPKAS